jgi:hypothetical protein
MNPLKPYILIYYKHLCYKSSWFAINSSINSASRTSCLLGGWRLHFPGVIRLQIVSPPPSAQQSLSLTNLQTGSFELERKGRAQLTSQADLLISTLHIILLHYVSSLCSKPIAARTGPATFFFFLGTVSFRFPLYQMNMKT